LLAENTPEDSKKILKEFALSFHEVCADRIAFEKMLKHIR
jgi:hypothetical protein